MSKKTTLNWVEYYFGHCFQTGWREMWNNFKMWRDLISGNYEGYALMWYDDPYNLTISPERKLRLDQKPPVVYVSEEAYDKLIEAINKPPEYNEKIARVLSSKAPWDDEND